MSDKDKYDDLDDVLDDFELGDHVLSRPPGHALEKMTLSEAEGDNKDGQSEQPQKPKTALTDAVHEPDQVESKSATPANPISRAEEDEQVAEELRKGMDELMEGFSGNPQMLEMFNSLVGDNGLIPPSAGAAGKNKSTAKQPAKPASFEDTISATVDRLHESRNAAPSAEGETGDAFLEQMLRELQGAAGGSGGENGGGMDDLLANLMEELSSKDVLYEPMKELHDKYPGWLEKNKDKLSADELARLKKQQGIVDEIVACFEKPSYSDSNKESRAFITAKMEEMQDSGAPPDELVGDLANGALPGVGGPGGDSVPDCGMQ